MMLDYFIENKVVDNIIKEIEKNLFNEETRTKDLKGNNDTKQSAESVLNNF
jgi:isocitrate/isopropylmalate dehydrogenase